MRRIASLLFAAFVALAAAPAGAEQLTEPSSELKFEKYPAIDGKRFVCLGTGIRKRLVFKVYALVFCAEERGFEAELAKYFEGPGKAHAALRGKALAEALEDDPGFYRFLMTAPFDKAAEMVFLRGVGKDTLKETFTDSLTRALGAGEKQRVVAFVNLMESDVKENDRLSLRTGASGAIALGLGDELKQIEDAMIARAVWESYLGPSGVSPALKRSVAAGVAALRR
jgi:hypothetical protein